MKPNRDSIPQQYETRSLELAVIQTRNSNRAITIAIISTIIGLLGVIVTIYFSLPKNPTPKAPYHYHATIPGKGCDTGKAKWVTVSYSQVTCLADRMELSTASSTGLGQELFYGTQHIPTDNAITVNIDSLSTGSCAGIITRNADTRKGGYAFAVCWDGTWAISIFDVMDVPHTLTQGMVPQADAYKLVVDTQGVSLRFNVNDMDLKAVADGTFTDTDSISLFVTPLTTGIPSTASFRDFDFSGFSSSS